jgi:acetyltransferase-like isoleucine patch superfamily enzyme
MEPQMVKNYIAEFARVSRHASLEPPVRMWGTSHVREDCVVGKFSFINDRTTLFPGTTVGRYCSIGKACEIGAPTHPDSWLTSSPVAFDIRRHFPKERHLFGQSQFQQYQKTTIGSDVWIGSLSLVFGGTNIGHGAIIGAGAIVTSDVPPYAIVAGSPARIIRYRFDEPTINKLLASQWWTLPEDKLATLDLSDPTAFLDSVDGE